MKRNSRPLSASEWLREQGVEFPPGSSAFYIKAAGTLNICNTPQSLDFVERIVDSLNQSPARRGMRKPDIERLNALKKTLKEKVIPIVDLDEAPLRDALDFVSMRAAEKGKLNPVQFVFNPPPDLPIPTVTLKLRNVPTGVVIKHIVDLAGCHSTVSPYGIEISPRAGQGGDLQIATFRLSAADLKKIHDSMTKPPGSFPIAETLKHIGIDFPPGAATFWNSITGDLIVRQTPPNLSRLDSLLQGLITQSE